MEKQNLIIRPVIDADRPLVDRLEAKAFGPGRYARTAYRIREQVATDTGIGLVAVLEEQIAGSIWFTPVRIGDAVDASLLGPLLVDPERLGQGIGSRLIDAGLKAAEVEGRGLVILVGDLAFYRRFGFVRALPGQMRLPGPVDGSRILIRALGTHNAEDYRGVVQGH